MHPLSPSRSFLSFLFVLLSILNSFAQKTDTTIQVQKFKDKELKEIIVYSAEKKLQTLLKTPSSISFIGGDQVQLLRLWEINNLSGIAPNFSLAQSGDNRNVAGIRGIVTTSYYQSVATYIDGVAQFNLDTYIPQLNDIESIEILRGPQGTFYGRNSMGGVINITTKKTTNLTSLQVDATVGNFNQKRISGILKTPIVKDKLYLSASILHDARNGYYTNDYDNSTYDNQRQNIGMIQLKYLLGKNWSMQADAKSYLGLNDGAFPLNGDYTTAISTNPFHLTQNQVTMMHDKTNNASFIIQHKGEKANFSLQSSYQNNFRYYENTLDADFSAYEIIGIYNNYGKSFNNVNAVINELKFQSANKKDKKLEWSTGIYQFTNSSPTKQATVFGKDAGLFGVPDKNFSLISYNLGKNFGMAAYAHATYHLTDKLSIQTGIRLDEEQKKLNVKSEYEKKPYPPFTILSDTSGKTRYNALSPKVGINFEATEHQFLYFTFSRGFRAGGISNISSDPSQLPLSSYLPEFSNMFELGWKGTNKVKSLQYSFAAFYNHVSNIQTPFLILPDGITITKNAGILNSKGMEWEFKSKPFKGLTLQYNGGITNAKYQKFTSVINGMQMSLDNNKQIFTPSHNQFFSSTYEMKIKGLETWANFQYILTGKQFFDITNVIEQKTYGLMHAQVGMKFKKFNIYIWGRNLTDKKYLAYGYDFGAVHLGNPRTIGLGISCKIL